MKKFIVFLFSLLFSSGVYATTYFTDFDGKVHTLDEYTGHGKWTVVMIWASDCHVCNKEAHQYIGFHEKHRNTDAVVVGLSMDGKKKLSEAKKFVTRHKVNFQNLIGTPQQVAGLYDMLTGGSFAGTPTFLIFSPEGELLAQQAGAVPVELIESFIEKNSAK